MKIIRTSLPGVIVFEPKRLGDTRGFFVETFRQQMLKDAGINGHFVQDNHSRSSKGVLRGLHYQLVPPQGKLVRVASGAVYDVAVDIRNGSPTQGQSFGVVLDEESMRIMYVPPGFAHGFMVISDTADFIYKCTDYYHPQSEQGILWNDPALNINWPLDDVILSKRDQNNPLLSQQPADKLPSMKLSKQ
jgi:dTDP-4-dehydrorhamnose 3,5-epimerase